MFIDSWHTEAAASLTHTASKADVALALWANTPRRHSTKRCACTMGGAALIMLTILLYKPLLGKNSESNQEREQRTFNVSRAE